MQLFSIIASFFIVIGFANALDLRRHLGKDDCICRVGRSIPIGDGQRVVPSRIPWLVSLADSYGSHVCSGIIINKKHILTSAQCVEGFGPKDFLVRAGVHDLRDVYIDEKTHLVDKIRTSYRDPSSGDSLAILKLKHRLKIVPGKVEPACLNIVRRAYEHLMILSGFGTTKYLRDNTVASQSSYLCSETTIQNAGDGSSNPNQIFNTGHGCPILNQAIAKEIKGDCVHDICIKGEPGFLMCEGHIGGPLHYARNGRISVEGIGQSLFIDDSTPEGKASACSNSGAYSRLSLFRDWIEEIVDDDYCKL